VNLTNEQLRIIGRGIIYNINHCINMPNYTCRMIPSYLMDQYVRFLENEGILGNDDITICVKHFGIETYYESDHIPTNLFRMIVVTEFFKQLGVEL
jgi:hypothetical protein